jgi:hypothetical protein
MKIIRRSPITGKINEMELPVTQAQLDAWAGGVLAQNAFPHLTADEREFIMTGMTKEDWDLMVG